MKFLGSRVVLLTAMLLLFVGAGFAQSAQITGRVIDESGALVPDVAVKVTNTGTGIVREVKTNAAGYYTVPLLTRGAYTVSAEATGFQLTRLTDITLDEGQVQRVDISLRLGQVTESVEVSATAQLLQTEDASVSNVVTNKSVVDLPLVGRNPLALATLNASVRATGRFGDLPVSSFDGSRASISGGAPSSNNYMVDGAASENFTSGGMNVFLSVDATEEFRIVTRNPSAEYGRTGGGVINVISKSGTNEYHGTAYWFHRNRALNANDFFSNRNGRDRQPFVFNQWGATIGGPVKKEKTFFFFNYEGFTQREQSRTFRTVPTNLQRSGNFSQTFAVVSGAPSLIRIFDPLTTITDPANPALRTRTQFTNNIIPTARLNPTAMGVMDFYPSATGPGDAITETNNFFGQASAPLDKKLWGLRIDQYLTPTRRLYGRYTYDTTFRGNPNFYDNIAETSTSDIDFPRLSAILNYTDSLTPTLLLELKAGLNRYAPNRPARSLGFDVASIGLPLALNTQVQLPIFPRFNLNDVSAIGGDQNDHLIQGNNAWTLGGSATWIRGAHTIKFGAEQRIYQLNNSQGGPVMQFNFARNFTRGPNPNTTAINAGHGLATFLLGTPTGGTARRYTFTTYTAKNFASYIQDDWKVTPKLTLNLGLRWEFEGAVTDRFDAISNFDPTIRYNVGGVDFVGGNTFVGRDGNSRGNRDNWYRDFGPRFGFAYQLRPNTVLRGGYGIYYIGTTGNFVRLGQAGFSQNTDMLFSADGGFTPADTLVNPFPDGIQLPPGPNGGPGVSLGVGAEGNLRTQSRPYSQQWNLNVQQQLPDGWLVELGYAGNRGVHLAANRELAYLPQQFLPMGAQLQQLVPNPFFGVITSGSLSAQRLPLGQTLRLFPQFTTATSSAVDNWASSTYHALTVRVERRFANGFSATASYAWSKLIDDNGGNGLNGFFNAGNNGVQNWDNIRAERAISSANMPHRLVMAGLWDLPFLRGRRDVVGRVLGGWQLNAIVTVQSGEPVAVTQNGVAFGGFRPDWIGNPKPANQNIDNWLDRSAFQLIQPFTFGNAPRNLPNVRTDSLFQTDFSVLKNIPVTEKVSMQARFEFFNLTNTPTFGNPGTNVSAGNFGVVNGLAGNVDPRRIQLGLKVIF
ncbi:MAG: carboxypeptidase regulatory-like domain-containing protein [Bryobacterales bacterium]|jgi:outer membrane receptor protein involved in Fe transport|nr:carboxypeptidase regulatory-like domain-containing protein [Bryobacterales bacterium]